MPEQLQTKPEHDRFMPAVSQEGYWSFTPHSGEVWHSDRLLAMLGRETGAPMCQLADVLSQLHPDDSDGFVAVLKQVLATGGAGVPEPTDRRAAAKSARTGRGSRAAADALPPQSFDHELRARMADGSWRWLRVHGEWMRSPDGQEARLCGSVTDIHREKTALAELEAHRRELEALVNERTARLESALLLAEQRRREAELASTAKSHFLAHMSHEIRTPLTGVLGLTELALRTPLSPQQRRYLVSAHESGHALLRVLSDVLDLSRIESGQVELQVHAFDPARAFAHAMRTVMPLNHDGHLLVLFDWEGDASSVVGDEGCLRQIVINLLANALKFTAQGHVSLTGQAWRQPGGMVRLRMKVADTGPGIAPHLRQSIFEPFVQGDAQLVRSHAGAGLGLAIARQLAEAMRARLTLDCPSAGGSVFTLEIDLPAGSDHGAIADESPVDPSPGLCWLIYANPLSAQWMSRRLARLGWNCRIFSSKAQALDAAQAPGHPEPALVLVAESALSGIRSLAPLRQALPNAAVRLMVNPPWQKPELEAEAHAMAVPILVAPYTPSQLARLAGSIESVEAPPPSDPVPAEQRAKVLLVEDNAVNQLVLQEFLQALGLTVQLAHRGAEAIASCIAQPPDLVLMDLELPDFDGLQAARRLIELQRQGAWPGAPIVALTAHATAADRAACRAAGMAAMLTKPMSLAMLRKRLARWLRV